MLVGVDVSQKYTQINNNELKKLAKSKWAFVLTFQNCTDKMPFSNYYLSKA